MVQKPDDFVDIPLTIFRIWDATPLV